MDPKSSLHVDKFFRKLNDTDMLTYPSIFCYNLEEITSCVWDTCNYVIITHYIECSICHNFSTTVIEDESNDFVLMIISEKI